jgi:hypothetical protein
MLITKRDSTPHLLLLHDQLHETYACSPETQKQVHKQCPSHLCRCLVRIYSDKSKHLMPYWIGLYSTCRKMLKKCPAIFPCLCCNPPEGTSKIDFLLLWKTKVSTTHAQTETFHMTQQNEDLMHLWSLICVAYWPSHFQIITNLAVATSYGQATQFTIPCINPGVHMFLSFEPKLSLAIQKIMCMRERETERRTNSLWIEARFQAFTKLLFLALTCTSKRPQYTIFVW